MLGGSGAGMQRSTKENYSLKIEYEIDIILK
jgi:hypothetical protein